MAQDLPASSGVISQLIKTDVQRELASSNPFLSQSWLGGIIVGLANRFFDFYHSLEEAALEALPDTAVDNLERWGVIYRINRIAGNQASGYAVATGVVGTSIPALSQLRFGDDLYQTTAGSGVSEISAGVSSLTQVDGLATLVTTVAHLFASNVLITVTGANEAEYNVVDLACQVIDENTLTYVVDSGAASPATTAGTITVAADIAFLSVISLVSGASQNHPLDAQLTFVSTITDIDDLTHVAALDGGITRGSDTETTEQLRDRLVDRIQNPIAHFNVAELTYLAKTVFGVTRVWVEEITPAVGQCTVYFTRDNDVDSFGAPDQIPDSAEVAEVDAVIQSVRPATTDEADVIISAPTATPVGGTDFTFTDLQPNTVTMQAAVTASLQQFFSEKPEVSTNVDADAYRAAIKTTIDPDTGAEVSTFTLSPDPGDITVASGSLGTLGDIVYP